MKDLSSIVAKFKVQGTIEEIKPLGTGLINDTYKVNTKEADAPDYVLQRINHAIFQNVEMLQSNITAVTNHIRKKLTEAGEADIERKVLSFLETEELPVTKEMFPDIKLDMFFFVSITTIIMAWTNLFPARKYTKYISWDILITIACAFAISKAMVNSGVADSVAKFIIGLSDDYGPHVLLAMVFIITNLFTELITNNAAAALAFPLALSISAQLGVSPTPFFVVICMAASASFSTPIGYQTNLIVQGIGNYKFTDFVRIGLPLNIITFLISVILIPLIWNF